MVFPRRVGPLWGGVAGCGPSGWSGRYFVGALPFNREKPNNELTRRGEYRCANPARKAQLSRQLRLTLPAGNRPAQLAPARHAPTVNAFDDEPRLRRARDATRIWRRRLSGSSAPPNSACRRLRLRSETRCGLARAWRLILTPRGTGINRRPASGFVEQLLRI